MGIRGLLLSGVTAFGCGLWVAGAVFHEPAKSVVHHRSQVPPAQLKWELWQPPLRVAPAAAAEPEPDLVMAPDPDRAPDPVFDTDEAAPATVWGTPEVWSPEE